jgi:hypothetical protein
MKSVAAVVGIVSVVLLATRNARAQDQAAEPNVTAVDTKRPAQTPDTDGDAGKPWTISITVDYLSQYIYRGYTAVPSGWILQPGIDLSYTIHDRDGLTITPHVAGWFNFTEDKGPDSPSHFAEADLFAGFAVAWRSWEFSANYNFQGYPSRYGIAEGSGQVQEVEFVLGYDDEPLWPDGGLVTAFYPYVGYFHEVQDRNDGDLNATVELGLEPTLRDFDVAGRSVTLSFPLTVGLSTDSYYTDADGHNERLGYWLAGVKATVALTDDGSAAGAWSLVGEIDYVRMESASTIEDNGGDRDDFVFRLGLAVEL